MAVLRFLHGWKGQTRSDWRQTGINKAALSLQTPICRHAISLQFGAATASKLPWADSPSLGSDSDLATGCSFPLSRSFMLIKEIDLGFIFVLFFNYLELFSSQAAEKGKIAKYRLSLFTQIHLTVFFLNQKLVSVITAFILFTSILSICYLTAAPSRTH